MKKNKSYKLRGIIDLVVNNCLVVDYKSSKSKKGTTQLFKNSNKDLVVGPEIDAADSSYNNTSSLVNVDFQSLIYLLNVNNNVNLENKDRVVEFYYYFPFNNKADIIKSGIDEISKISSLDTEKGKSFEKNIVKVRYNPMYFKDFIKTNEFLEILKNTKDRSEYINSIGDDLFLNYLKENELDFNLLDFDIDNYKKTTWYVKLFDYLKDLKSDKKKIENVCNQIYKIRFCERTNLVLFFKEDINHFIDFLSDQQKLVCKYTNTLFPYIPIKDSICEKCSYNTICLKRFE
jgi:hypothetical protein